MSAEHTSNPGLQITLFEKLMSLEERQGLDGFGTDAERRDG
ncbi:hypothetical protein [Mumia zhuanghuii]